MHPTVSVMTRVEMSEKKNLENQKSVEGGATERVPLTAAALCTSTSLSDHVCVTRRHSAFTIIKL